jgi:ankyrin repeat protein
MSILPVSAMSYYFFFKITLYCKGRELFDLSKNEYPLHKAVFENNLPLISRLINCTHDGVFFANKNELDLGGNTPLNLAVKLGYVDAVKVLSDLFTCPKLKSLQNCKYKE